MKVYMETMEVVTFSKAHEVILTTILFYVAVAVISASIPLTRSLAAVAWTACRGQPHIVW
jgi:hypothetical protein